MTDDTEQDQKTDGKKTTKKVSEILTPVGGFPTELEERGERSTIYISLPPLAKTLPNGVMVRPPSSHAITIPAGHIGIIETHPVMAEKRCYVVHPEWLIPGKYPAELLIENRASVANKFKGEDITPKTLWHKAATLLVIKASIVKG